MKCRKLLSSVLIAVMLLLLAHSALAEDVFTVSAPSGTPMDGEYYLMEKNGHLLLDIKKSGKWQNANVTWSSSNPAVATVEVNVVFAHERAGYAILTATAQVIATGETITREIKVCVATPSQTPGPSQTTLSLHATDGVTTLRPESTVQLVAEVSPRGTPLRWESSDEKVLTVSAFGMVTAHREGSAKVTVTAENGSGVNASISLSVKTADVLVTLNRGDVKLYVGGTTAKFKRTFKLQAKVRPSGAHTTLTWSSSDPSVVTVGNKGMMTAHKAGTASVRVTTGSGDRAQCRVTVYKLPTGVKLPAGKIIQVGGKVNLRKLLKVNGNVTEVKWRSANPKIAKVNSEGVVLGVRPGQTKVAVKTVNGKVASCVIRVVRHKGVTAEADLAPLTQREIADK
ncbi:MAG: Ig-like domain-containing protein [Clostridia bacterium]